MSKLLDFQMRKIKEGLAEIFIPIGKKISKKLPVFYNPIMELNRNITILLLQQFSPMNLCDPLAASGIRAIRFAKELTYKSITANDMNKKAFALIKKNMKHNKVNFGIYNKDANLMLLESKGFDFIDLDVFGSPNFMLDSACKRIARDGILAVTATDTSALCGTFPKACLRKYWAVPKKDAVMHETGLRILIRKIQLIAAQYDKALTPIFSYSKEHYMRVFLRNEKGKNKSDKILKQHGHFNSVGPLWLGSLWDKKLASSIYSNALKNKRLNKNKEPVNFLRIIKDESKINAVGFYDLHDICGKNKIQHLQKREEIINKIKKIGYKASRTHFKGDGIRSNMSYLKLVHILVCTQLGNEYGPGRN